MEERVEYEVDGESGEAVRPRGRVGKTFVGGYIDTGAALRLRRACELNECSMTTLLESMAARVTATFAAQGCGHE